MKLGYKWISEYLDARPDAMSRPALTERTEVRHRHDRFPRGHAPGSWR